MFALILESLSSTELLFILVIALIFFGPRKLPQLARSMGKGLAEFRKASDDFKRTWEREVALEAAKLETDHTILDLDQPHANGDQPQTHDEQPQTYLEEKPAPEPIIEPANPELVVARGTAPEPLAASVEPLSPANELPPADRVQKQNWL